MSGPCIGNDPLCPCQDGDMCHYRGPDAWPIPERNAMTEVRLYRFYNMELSRHGEPFALCDVCRQRQRVPGLCLIEKLANQAVLPCDRCGRQECEVKP